MSEQGQAFSVLSELPYYFAFLPATAKADEVQPDAGESLPMLAAMNPEWL